MNPTLEQQWKERFEDFASSGLSKRAFLSKQRPTLPPVLLLDEKIPKLHAGYTFTCSVDDIGRHPG